MFKPKCVNCIEYKNCKEDAVSVIYFIVGLIAIIAIRAVTILEHVRPLYGKIAWYVGVIGFTIYFAYKFRLDKNRYRLIKKNRLMDKVAHGHEFKKEDREILRAILCALSSDKDRINYFIIFISSALVLIMALYLDFR